MAVGESSVSKVEKRRIELEENVAKLQASLRHWQAWEIEYEGMKEEILKLGDKPALADINKTADSSDEASIDSNKVLLTRKEKLLIIRDEKGVTRKPDQILNLLSRRIDYVQKNIQTTSSLLRTAQKNLLASEVLTEAKALNEEGLPLIDILEELDEDGNVISSSTSVPGETAPKAVEAIERAAELIAVDRDGGKPASVSQSIDAEGRTSSGQVLSPSIAEPKSEESLESPVALEEPKKNPETAKSSKSSKASESPKEFGKVQILENSKTLKSGENSEVSRNLVNQRSSKPSGKVTTSREPTSAKNIKHAEKPSSPKKAESPKKQVSFASDVEVVSASESARNHKASEQRLLQEISDREADEFERNEMAESVIPEDESPEDALLRRQMIQYNMEEVGAVVAEIDLEDDGISQSEYDSEVELEGLDGEGLDLNDDDEEEDEFGRTTKSKPLDGAYVRRMQALSDKLKASAMINVGPGKPTGPTKTKGVSTSETPKSKSKTTPSGKKGVRFAEDLDIQEAPKDVSKSTSIQDEDPDLSVVNLLAASSAITGKAIGQMRDSNHMEATKTPSETPTATPGSSSKKVSKFKAARAHASTNANIETALNSTPKPAQTPQPHPPKIFADTLVERPFTPSNSAAPPPPPPTTDPDTDLPDPALLKSQVSTEYHRLRNRQIHREGGFLRREEGEQDDDDDDVDGSQTAGASITGPPYNNNDAAAAPQKKMSRFKAARLGLQ